jgi:hypothetical protein
MISEQQQKRIDKLDTDEFYLIGFDEKEILMTGSTKNVYKVSLSNDGSMTCNCPDSETHAKRFKVMCKHICFIYLKICKSTDLTFFNTKKLSDNDISKLEARTKTLTSTDIAKKYYDNYLSHITNKSLNLNFDEAKRENSCDDAECPICFEELSLNIKFCPQCSNPVHEKCITKWLEQHDTCVYCRSDVWKKYNNNDNDNDNDNDNEKEMKSKYINLQK